MARPTIKDTPRMVREHFVSLEAAQAVICYYEGFAASLYRQGDWAVAERSGRRAMAAYWKLKADSRDCA